MDNTIFRTAPRTRRQRSEVVGTNKWVEPTVTQIAELSPAEARIYVMRKVALEMYRQCASGDEIELRTTLPISEVGRLHRRAEKMNPATDAPEGFYVCLPSRRLQLSKHVRRKAFDSELAKEGSGQKLAMTSFFVQYADIKRNLDVYLRTRRLGNGTQDTHVNAASTVRAFHHLCRAKGLHEQVPPQWPFNTSHLGANAIRDYYAKWKANNPLIATGNERGDAAALEARVDLAVANDDRLAVEAPCPLYGRVEMDGVLIPVIGAVIFRNKHGVDVVVETRRLYALIAVDRRLPLILGARVSFGLRYDVNDVLALLRQAIFPPARRALTLQNDEFNYLPGAGYPAEVIPSLRENVWQELALDADKAHLSAADSKVITELLRCRVANERVGSPTARAAIENLNGFLSAACNSQASATGTGPRDVVRRDPEVAAVSYAIRIELLEELLDVWARNWNARYRPEVGMTPLQAAKQLADKNEVFYNQLGALSGEDRRHEFYPRFRRELRFGRTTHGVLLVNLFGARYTGPDLAGNARLAGSANQACTVYVNDEDAREAWVVPDAYPEMRIRVVVQNEALRRFKHPLYWRRMTSWWTAKQGIHERAVTPDLMRGFAQGIGESAKEGDPDARAIFSTILGEQARVESGAVSHILSPPEIDLPPPVLDAEEANEAELDVEHQTQLAPKRPRKPRKPAPQGWDSAPLPTAARHQSAHSGLPARVRGVDLGLGL